MQNRNRSVSGNAGGKRSNSDPNRTSASGRRPNSDPSKQTASRSDPETSLAAIKVFLQQLSPSIRHPPAFLNSLLSILKSTKHNSHRSLFDRMFVSAVKKRL